MINAVQGEPFEVFLLSVVKVRNRLKVKRSLGVIELLNKKISMSLKETFELPASFSPQEVSKVVISRGGSKDFFARGGS